MEDHKKISEILEKYSQAIEEDPKNPAVHTNRGNTYYKMKDYKNALSDYSRAIELAPEDAAAYYNRGILYRNIGDYERALGDYSRAIELDPEDAATYNNRGLTYYNMKDYKNALVDYSRAIEENPEYAIGYYNRGLTYYNMGDYEEAIANYSRAIKLAPKYVSAYYNRGNTYYDIGDYERALENYSRVIKLAPEYAAAYNNRGLTYYKMEDYKNALEDYSRAIELDPDASAYNNRGVLYNNMGAYKKALADYSKAIEEDPEYMKVYTNQGNTYYNIGKYEKALENYSKVAELDPEDKEIKIKSELFKRILEVGKDEKIIKELVKLFNLREKILEILHVKRRYDFQVAHYTSENVSTKILNKEESYLRLNIASLSNDPTEGRVLFDFLNGKIKGSARNIPFITCFSYEIDSLNQLRLYGKKDKEEATGVGLIFDKSFFSSRKLFSIGRDSEELASSIEDSNIEVIKKPKKNKYLPLYRCVYLGFKDKDREEIFCNIAKESEWNKFCNKNNKTIEEDKSTDDERVKNKFKEIFKTISELESESESKDINDLILDILLPIQYLVKDPAFQEERECRIIHITNKTDDNIEQDENINRIYIDYKIDIKNEFKPYPSP